MRRIIHPRRGSLRAPWRLSAFVAATVAAAVGVGWLVGCRSRPDGPADVPDGPALPEVAFVDVTKRAGIDFTHTNGASGKKLLPETMGSGVAFLDYDNDGRQDLLFINSCPWPGHEDHTKPAPTLKLYRNQGDGTFADVTRAAGLDVTLFGMGVTVGDYDNDGYVDVFVTGVGGNRLFHNEDDGRGGRRFRDVTAEAGVGGPGGWPAAGDFLTWDRPVNFSTSATWLDYDRDGLLDLFVCNYVRWSPARDLKDTYTLGGTGRAYGPPDAFDGVQCFLYHNLGRGRFREVGREVGLHVFNKRGEPRAKSLGVIAYDLDGDGWPDIVVANDTVPNFLFHNERGTFREVGEAAGVALAEGSPRGAMGIDAGWYRPDRLALAIGNFADEPDSFLRLDDPKRLLFTDVAQAEGLAGPSRVLLKFGLFFFDYDLDGRPDLFTCDGHLEPEIARVRPAETYAQPAQLFWNAGGRRPGFELVTSRYAGEDLFRPMVGRGCAFADIDGDGYLDVVLTANGGPARLLHNEGGTGNHWLRLVMEGDGKHSNRSAIGAVVTVEADGHVQRQQVTAGRGYLSQSELPLTFGLGKAERVDRVTVRWPDAWGTTEVRRDLKVDRAYHLRQGDGK
jgi:hypothetical protein